MPQATDSQRYTKLIFETVTGIMKIINMEVLNMKKLTKTYVFRSAQVSLECVGVCVTYMLFYRAYCEPCFSKYNTKKTRNRLMQYWTRRPTIVFMYVCMCVLFHVV